MLYSFTTHNTLQPLAPMPGLTISECHDPQLMAMVGETTQEETQQRFANGHKAFVAYWHGEPASFGWMATTKARIGELNHELGLPAQHAYLWNFRTLSRFRGQGIYPHLLQYILSTERAHTECFWIMHAPENKASERGITKAGFKFMGKVSVVNGREVIFYDQNRSVDLTDVLAMLGFTASEEEQATCWNCSSPYIKNKKPQCCCSEAKTECNAHLFQAG